MGALALAVMSLALAQGEQPAVSRQALQPPSARSFLGGETLGEGNSVTSVAVGYPRLTAIYGFGVSEAFDLGAVAAMDWLSTELVAGALVRRHLAGMGRMALAARGRLGLYRNFGAGYAVAGNAADTGAHFEGGVAVGFPVGAGTLSLGGDLPYAITWDRGWGTIFSPRLSLGFETPLLGDLSLGAQAGMGWRFATGAAPGAVDTDGRPLVELAAVATYQVF
jgi:hypothetical protein